MPKKEKEEASVPKELSPLEKVGKILEEHNFMESNIPVNHPSYWTLRNQINASKG